MLDWENLSNELAIENEQSALYRLGVQVKELYIDVISSDRTNAEFSPFESCVVAAVEEASKHSSRALEDSYKESIQPLRDDTLEVAHSFVKKFMKNFRDALCSEVYDNPDLTSNARGTIIVLAPTLITLLGLPLPYAALAVPLSVIVSRIGIKSLCQDYELQKQSKDFMKQRLEICRKNLLFLEQERARYSSGSVPAILVTAIEHDETKIHELEEKTRSL